MNKVYKHYTKGTMCELTLWTDNPEIDIDKISQKINISPVEKELIGDIKYFGEANALKRVVDVSSLEYSTGHIDTTEVECAITEKVKLIEP